MLTHFAAARIGQPVKAKAVLLDIDLSQKPLLQSLQLRQVHPTLENRLLYPLTTSFADLGYTAQSSLADLGLGTYVVANDNQHGASQRIANGTYVDASPRT